MSLSSMTIQISFMACDYYDYMHIIKHFYTWLPGVFHQQENPNVASDISLVQSMTLY